MSNESVSDTSTAELDVSKAHQPAPAADDQKATPATPDETVVAQETPEQVEERRKQKEREHNQRRLQRRTTEAAEAKAEAKLLREERDRLRSQLDAQGRSQETGEPKREDFQDLEAYLRAVTKFEAKQEATATLKAEREAEQGREKKKQDTEVNEKVAKAWAERETSFQSANKDYEKVVAPFLDEELQSFSSQARRAIVESEVGPALLFHLATNTDEADRIAELSPLRQIAELGKLEAKVSMPAKKTTSAPAPASTTSGGRTATKDLNKMSQEEYEAERKSQGARWG